MSPTDFWEGLGNGIWWSTEIIFDHIGNIFNYSMIALGLIGAVIWLRLQLKYEREAKKDPDGIH